MIEDSVSVILATRNEEKYIGRTLDVLRKVMHSCLIKGEIIIIDSSEDDRTVRAAAKYTDNIFKFNEKGVSKARNFGVSKAFGNIIVFMDADSIPQNCIFQDLARAFKNQKVVAAVPYVYPYDQKIAIEQKAFYIMDIAFIRSCRFIPSLLKLYNRGDFFAVKKDIFEKIGGFNRRLNIMEITDLITRIQTIGKIAILNKPVYESSRRLRTWGVLRSHLYWWITYIRYYLQRKPVDKTYPTVR